MRFVKTVNINFTDNLATFLITKSLWSYLKLLLISLLELGFGFDQSLPRGKPVGKSPYYRSFDRSANWRVKDSIRDGMSSIGDSWTDEVTKNIFLNNNTFHLIIMMISVVLCKINEEINYVSIFHNHVVRIWLHNRPAKLSWNRNKNSKLQMLCLEYIVWWYGQFVTNWYHFIEMSFHSTKLSSWRMAKSLVIWVKRAGHTGPLTVNKIWRCRRGIGEYGVIFTDSCFYWKKYDCT